MLTPDYVNTLEQIQQRVLWLATRLVHEANHVRPNPDGVKVGGHQASSASMVSIMTALYFHFLEAGDRVAVKPHASPVFHAIQYLLGQLPQSYLTTLRSYGGLQAYPSRTKDPDPVDFSTGSVGLGAVAPSFAALAHHYAKAHFGEVTSKRFIAILGDAELDEGNIWEALLNEWMSELSNVIWIVDLNRQSLDRVVPGIRANHLKSLFANCGWQVLEAKYGQRLQTLFAQPGGEKLRQRIDDMSNEEYQYLIRLPGDELRQRLVRPGGRKDKGLAQLVEAIPDAELPSVIGNLGGHDLSELTHVLAQADAERRRPSVIFAYTIKGWGLPIAGDPLNHSKLLTPEQIDALREKFCIPPADEWAMFAAGSAEAELCQEAASRLYARKPAAPQGLAVSDVPESVALRTEGMLSTQQSFGQLLVSLSRDPVIAERIVTTSPDVSTSTNLSGWIAKQGVFAFSDRELYEMEENRALSWRYGPHGQHIELGISEMNLFMALGMLGLSAELCGQQLVPIGTVYDPFVLRGLDAFIYGLYSNARFIIVATPSGVSLSPEGGAHQSTVTPGLGSELANLNAYEPCFAQELVWIMLEAIRQCCRSVKGRSTYLRLSTQPIDQALLNSALERLGANELRRQVLAGGYRLVDNAAKVAVTAQTPLVQIATTGVMAPEAVEAAQMLAEEGIVANVLNLTSPRALFERWQAGQWGAGEGDDASLFDWLIRPTERHAPIVTVQDGASHNLAWLGSIHGAKVVPLGVDHFGQSGTRNDLYHHFGIDRDSIFRAALVALNRHMK